MDNTENRKTLAAILALVAILAGLIIWSESNSQSSRDQSGSDQTQDLRQEIAYQGEEGRTALDILKDKYQVETQQFTGLGEFVTAINGQQAGNTSFWAYYVNGQMGQIGADQYQTKSTDRITWKLEAVN